MRGALYARYSTELQSEASIADQLRVCERLALQHGIQVVAAFSDAAISGGTTHRPGYQGMLAAARRGDFDAIVAEDTSRLWRNLAEQAPRLAELADLNVQVVTCDLDTRHESAAILGAVQGAMSEQYRREIARRTRRGLEGRARAGRSAGGRAYGYRSQAEAGERQVDPDRAPIVREIFERFAAGETLRAIASDLNGRRVPSPGAAWRRSSRPTDGLWRVSALHAILHNDQYVGRSTWNRSRWVRSAADSKTRRRVENPPEQWVVQERPDLAIVDPETFERAQARLGERAELFKPGRGGRASYLLSGFLRCAVCGGAFTVAAHRPVRYACSTRRNAGDDACANGLMVGQLHAEDLILGDVKRALLAPEARAFALAEMARLARLEADAPSPELAKVEAQIGELERLKREGVLSAEIAGAALSRAYRDRDAARRATAPVSDVLFGADGAYAATVADLWRLVEGDDMGAARGALRDLVGPVKLHPAGDHLVAEVTGGRLLPLGLNWNGSGGPLWIGLRRAG
jgi:site-specific DNA recombinase